MSMTPSEQIILELWDNGSSIEEIAHRLGKPRETVGALIATFDGSADYRAYKTEMRAGSASLLAAIQQVRA